MRRTERGGRQRWARRSHRGLSTTWTGFHFEPVGLLNGSWMMTSMYRGGVNEDVRLELTMEKSWNSQSLYEAMLRDYKGKIESSWTRLAVFQVVHLALSRLSFVWLHQSLDGTAGRRREYLRWMGVGGPEGINQFLRRGRSEGALKVEKEPSLDSEKSRPGENGKLG